MRFDLVLSDLREGRAVRRRSWGPNSHISTRNSKMIDIGDIFADDWEVIYAPFNTAMNSLLRGATIRRHSACQQLGTAEATIIYTDGKVLRGAGTSKVGSYDFTKDDMTAGDWIIDWKADQKYIETEN